MNNAVIHNGNSTYVRIDDWYIGIHVVSNTELVIYADHNHGKVTDDHADTEDDNQWGKLLRVDSPRRKWFPSPNRRTMRNRVHVEVRD